MLLDVFRQVIGMLPYQLLGQLGIPPLQGLDYL